METDLDKFHEWILASLTYDGTVLVADLVESNPTSKSQITARIFFRRPFLHLLAEEAMDSVWGIPTQKGFLKDLSQGEDVVRSSLKFDFFPFYLNAKHYRLHTRDEVLHVFTNLEPEVLISEISSGSI